MEFKFRSKTLGVAVGDLMMSSLALCACVYLAVNVIIVTGVSNTVTRPQTSILIYFWTTLCLTTIAAAVQVWAATNLFNSTKKNIESCLAGKKCKNWRRVSFFSSILLLAGVFLLRGDLLSNFFSVLQVLLRAYAIYIVTAYLEELETSNMSITSLEKIETLV